MNATIYHNQACSKSNAVLNLLIRQGVSITMVNYLERPLTASDLEQLLKQLGIDARDLVRFGEPVAREIGITIEDARDQAQWLLILEQYPALIERPIVLVNNEAVIARPPELAIGLLQKHFQGKIPGIFHS